MQMRTAAESERLRSPSERDSDGGPWLGDACSFGMRWHGANAPTIQWRRRGGGGGGS